MGEIHEALKRAAEARQVEAEDASPEREAPPPSSTAPSVSEVVAAARGELPIEHSSSAPELADSSRTPPAERLCIPRDRTGNWAARAVLVTESGGSAEAYHHFAIRVRRELSQRSANSVIVISALRGEGKTTTSCNLALALASMSGGKRVALVDLDLRRPKVAQAFGARPKLGIDDVLRGRAKLAEVCLATDIPTLDLYPVATQMQDPHGHLSSSVLPELLADLHANYQTVVIDSPPMLLVPDAALIVPHLGGAVPVLRPRTTRRRAFEEMIGRMPPGSLLGCFLNGGNSPLHATQYGYYQDDEPSQSGSERNQ